MQYKKPLTATDIINQSCSTPEEEADLEKFIMDALIDNLYDAMVRDGLIKDDCYQSERI